MSEGLAWGLSPVWLLLGMIVAILLLLQFPGLYENLSTAFTAMKQSCTCICVHLRGVFRPDFSPDDDPTYHPGDDIAVEADPASSHTYDYSEIDMGKAQTLQLSNSQRKAQTPQSNISQQTPHLRYEDCVIDQRNSHPYSNYNRDSLEMTDNGDRMSAVHNYAILEPGSNRRLVVRVLTDEYLEDDPSRIYFKLEPGTDKVTPQFHMKFEDIKKKSSDHTYFVLEPSEDIIEDENAYAVENLMEHKYFTLERTYSNM